jgi:hydroxymethylglutaryl-CoA reductase
MSSLVRDFDNIHEGWEMSFKAKNMINAAKDHIEEMLKKQQFRKFIVDKILSNYTDEQKKMLDERRSRQEDMFNESTTYSISVSDNIFDPEVDEF